MKSSGKTRVMILLKVAKNRISLILLKNTFLEKPQDRCHIDPPLAILGLKHFFKVFFASIPPALPKLQFPSYVCKIGCSKIHAGSEILL